MIIYQPSDYERDVLYDKFMNNQSQSNGASQQSLFPQTAEFSSADFALLLGMEAELNALKVSALKFLANHSCFKACLSRP